MAKDEKKGFVIYYDYRQHLDLLTDEERGRLLTALLNYGETGQEPELEGALAMAFSFVRAQMDRDAKKYAEKVKKRSEAGKQGGRPSKASAENEKQSEAKKANAFSEKQSEAKKADTETETETGTGTETGTETETGTGISPEGDMGDKPSPPAAPPTPYKKIVDLYHEICTSFSRLRSVGVNRKKAIAARWKEYEYSLDAFRELFTLAEASDFLKGKNKSNWTADFDWLLDSTNMSKVLEGKYNDKPKGGDHSGENRGHPGGYHQEGQTTAATLSGFHMAD